MPLIVMCGYPSSGKSTWAQKIANYFQNEHGKAVHVVKEEDFLPEGKNEILDNSFKEKNVRAKVKSEAQRLLTKDNVVIVDALNYIKGYRYELFCASKGIPTRQATVQCEVSIEQAWNWNVARDEIQKYSKEVFDHLIQRFELPDPNNRWDSPYFSILANEELDLSTLYNSLFLNRPPKPNQSTQNKPVSELNFLRSLEKVTSEIIQAVLEFQKSGETGEIDVPHSQLKVNFEKPASLAQLSKLKRQFVTLTKTSSVKGDSGDLFVQYLNSQIQ